MFQPWMMSVMCSILLLATFIIDSKGLVELQRKLQCRVLVKFLMRFRHNRMFIDRCWASMRGHGSSSVIWLFEISMCDSEDRFADSSNTCGSMNEIRLYTKISVCRWRRLVNTPSCHRPNSQQF